MSRRRKRFTAEEKVAILRRHLLDKLPISQVCDEYHIQPTQFYRWQKEFFENGVAAFESKKQGKKSLRQQDSQTRRIAALEAKLQKKDNVLGELMEEHIQLKKTLGEL